jgi:hypothetical protein
MSNSLTNIELIDFLLDRNAEQSALFCSPDAGLARRRYRVIHPTEIIVLKCMDGRLNGSVITETPVGILQPIRNIGGQFDLGWPFLGAIIGESVNYAISMKRKVLILVTYHWSKGDDHRGCRGFNYNVEAAKEHALRVKKQIEVIFGKHHSVVYPIMVGIETDEDALVIHGSNGDRLDLAKESNTSEDFLLGKITNLFQDMDEQIISDLLPLVQGNLRHIAKLRKDPREKEEMIHREQIMALGRGFDWLHLLNKVLIIGPYTFDLAEPIETAAKILLNNLTTGVIPKEQGVVLFTSGAYREDTGFEPMLASEKAISMSRFAQMIIEKRVPDLKPFLHTLTGRTNLNTRLFTPVDN